MQWDPPDCCDGVVHEIGRIGEQETYRVIVCSRHCDPNDYCLVDAAGQVAHCHNVETLEPRLHQMAMRLVEFGAAARAAYRDPSFVERRCDRCGQPYQGPAVYCSHPCALADA